MPVKTIAMTGLTALLLLAAGALAWDGNWTNAPSGQDPVIDFNSSHMDSGMDDRPEKYFTPPPRNFVDVDPEELGDYFRRFRSKDYAPYALARISQSIRYNGLVLPKGYYLIKPGDNADGSPRVNLGTLNGQSQLPVSPGKTFPVAQVRTSQMPEQPAPQDMADLTVFDRLQSHQSGGSPMPSLDRQQADAQNAKLPLVDASAQEQLTGDGNANAEVSLRLERQAVGISSEQTLKEDKIPFRVFVIKQQGKVVAVVPIHRVEIYRLPRSEKVPRQALAWVEMEDRHPVLKFYWRKRLYSTDFQ